MAREQVSKSEQIMPNMSMVFDYDQPLTTPEDILKAFKNALGEDCFAEKYNRTKTVYSYKHDGITEYFLTGSVTYLSKPHPLFKKRYQLKSWHKEFYNEYKNTPDSRIHLVGIYHYEGLVVFVLFKIEDYIERKLNSSAAHVYTNDIYQAVTNGIFEKKDRQNNHITAIASRKFKEYLLGKATGNQIFRLFEKFNTAFPFNRWLPANQAIMEMRDGNWYQWKGTEWPGWLLEFKLARFIDKECCHGIMVYIGNIKDSTMLDFDLFFQQGNYYGDLKASDIAHTAAPGNDQENVLEAISHYGKLWYIIYEHETIKDTERCNEMAIARMNLIGIPYVDGKEISYASRMKHSVNFKRMRIFELNRINMNEALCAFNQGHQPNGSARKPKFLINKQNIDNCIVYSYDASSGSTVTSAP